MDAIHRAWKPIGEGHVGSFNGKNVGWANRSGDLQHSERGKVIVRDVEKGLKSDQTARWVGLLTARSNNVDCY